MSTEHCVRNVGSTLQNKVPQEAEEKWLPGVSSGASPPTSCRCGGVSVLLPPHQAILPICWECRCCSAPLGPHPILPHLSSASEQSPSVVHSTCLTKV